jgi:hypothetical protein
MLRGLLPLILDDNMKTELCGYVVEYSEEIGLSVTRKEHEE